MTEQVPQRKTFRATLLVTREEQWTVEAETAEEARELLLVRCGRPMRHR
jgi:hypothetical protein